MFTAATVRPPESSLEKVIWFMVRLFEWFREWFEATRIFFSRKNEMGFFRQILANIIASLKLLSLPASVVAVLDDVLVAVPAVGALTFIDNIFMGAFGVYAFFRIKGIRRTEREANYSMPHTRR